METESFLGNALNGVDGKGRLSVPAFVRAQIDRISDARQLYVGVHESKPCLTVHGPGFADHMLRELDRRGLAEESRGGDLDDLDDRADAVFGMTERVPYDSSGRIILPAMLRDEGGIEDLALFVGRHRYVALWNPWRALEHGGERLKKIAAFHLKERGLRP